jgi:glycosyltransferase involved in cell wall biosynthesis
MGDADKAPTLSVVIPSHFRPQSLKLVLDGLSRQTVSPSIFEVIVVLDGHSEESRQLETSRWPFRLKMIAQPQLGGTAARNRGLQEAAGEITVALDDDLIPTPSLLERHLQRHSGRNDLLVFGTFVCSPQSPETVVQAACDWSDVHRQRMDTAKDDPATYASLVVDANLSAPTGKLRAIGGWDESITGVGGSDDLELAGRWLRAGFRLQPAPEALGEHYWCKTWSQHLRDQRAIGHAHQYLTSKSPDIASKLDYNRITSRLLGKCAALVAKRLPAFVFSWSASLTERFGRNLRDRFARFTTRLIRASGVLFYLRGFAEGYPAERP